MIHQLRQDMNFWIRAISVGVASLGGKKAIHRVATVEKNELKAFFPVAGAA